MKLLRSILICSTLLLIALAQELPLSVLDIAKETSEHTMLVAGLYKANLVKTLSKANPVTIFAPNDKAFRDTGRTSTEILEDPLLSTLLQSHIIPGKWGVAEIIADIDLGGGSTEVKTLNGETLTLSVVDGNIILNDKVAFITPDLEAEDGIIHVIDSVIK